MQLPPDADMRAYAACHDALWALDNLGQVFIRTLSKSCPTGMHWTRLDLSQLGMAPCPSRMNAHRTLSRLLDFGRLIGHSCR